MTWVWSGTIYDVLHQFHTKGRRGGTTQRSPGCLAFAVRTYDFPISRQRGKKYPASYAQISVNTAFQVTVDRSHFPWRILEFSRIPHRILAKSRIPKIPFQTSPCSELLRATQKRTKSRSHYPCEIEIKIYLRIVDFPVLKKTKFDKVNVSSPYIMMWNTVSQWKLVPCKIPCKDKKGHSVIFLKNLPREG